MRERLLILIGEILMYAVNAAMYLVLLAIAVVAAVCLALIIGFTVNRIGAAYRWITGDE